MEKKTFMQKLKNMGPAAIITSAFIGPGTITTATLVGVKFQYALLWAVVFSGIALIVLMEMSSRIAIASHKNVIDAAIALKPESRGWRLFVQIFVGLAVGISCYNSSIGKTRIKMQTFRIIAKNPSHENAASKLVPAAVRFFVLAKFVRSKQHPALLYETAVLLFSPLSTRRCAMI